MNVQKNGVTITVAILLGIAALFIGIFVVHQVYSNKIDVAQFHGTYLEHPKTVNQFSLMGIDQKPFNNSSLLGNWTLVFFGFTNCSSLCPTTMAELGKMYRLLEKKQVKNLPHVVMVSVDPDRDDLDKLGHYVTSFHATFYGAKGDEDSIQAMAHEMGIAYAKIVNKDGVDGQNYDIQHGGAVMLFNPQGELNAFFTTPHYADLLVKDYVSLTS
ncbi:MAG: SCO family protein [Legionellales bacterium]